MSRIGRTFLPGIAGLASLVGALILGGRTPGEERVEARELAYEAVVAATRATEKSRAERNVGVLEERVHVLEGKLVELLGAADQATSLSEAQAYAMQAAEATAEAELAHERSVERVDHFEERLGKIERAVIPDPEKALAVPMMRRDIDTLAESMDHRLARLQAENDRAYDLMKWVIGLMGVVSLGLLGTAVSNAFGRRGEPEHGRDGRA